MHWGEKLSRKNGKGSKRKMIQKVNQVWYLLCFFIFRPITYPSWIYHTDFFVILEREKGMTCVETNEEKVKNISSKK